MKFILPIFFITCLSAAEQPSTDFTCYEAAVKMTAQMFQGGNISSEPILKASYVNRDNNGNAYEQFSFTDKTDYVKAELGYLVEEDMCTLIFAQYR